MTSQSRGNSGAWSTPTDIKDRLRRRWQRGDILASAVVNNDLFPLRIPIKYPTSAQITADFGAASDWIALWRDQSTISCEWRKVSHRLFGNNELPVAAIFQDATAAVKLLGARKEWDTFLTMTNLCSDTCSTLIEWLANHSLAALDLAQDWPALLAVISWIRDHPNPGVFVRQIDAPGVHSKLVEKHRGVLSELLDLALPDAVIDPTARGVSGFNRRYGFRDKPERIRFRFLDPTCVRQAVSLGLDLTLDATAFAALDPLVEHVFITENEINFLAFPNCAKSLVIFGAGYGWVGLARADWIHERHIHYWGDIDSHGFAILDDLRAIFPMVLSLLMNKETLLSLRDFWTIEQIPTRREFQRLTPDEHEAVAILRQAGSGGAHRLEQEKVPFSMLMEALRRIPIQVD